MTALPLPTAPTASGPDYLRSLDRLRAWGAHETGQLRRQLAALEQIIDGALRLELAYQPIVDLERGVAAGFEALSRFPPPLEGSPARWYSLAESLGLDLALQDRALRTVLPNRKEVPPNCFLTFNVTPQYLVSPLLPALLDEVGDFQGLVVEVTENAAIDDFEQVHRRIEQIRDVGGRFAVDDAGAGYASLNHVLQTRPDIVKLDRVFVTGCHQDRAKSALIEMLGQVAGRLDAWIVAEGVESDGELEELQRLGVTLVQGYRLGRPAAQMVPLDRTLGAAVRGRARSVRRDSGLDASVEALPSGRSPDDAGRLLDEDADLVAVVDEWERPTALLERHPLCGVRLLAKPMRVQGADAPDAVLHRALTRPPEQRFDPLLVVDEAGRLDGAVRIDRLAARLVGAKPERERPSATTKEL